MAKVQQFKCLFCKRPATGGDHLQGRRCANHLNPNFKARMNITVWCHGGGRRAWIHPSNIRVGGYRAIIALHPESGQEYCLVDFSPVVDYSKR